MELQIPEKYKSVDAPDRYRGLRLVKRLVYAQTGWQWMVVIDFGNPGGIELVGKGNFIPKVVRDPKDMKAELLPYSRRDYA